MIRINIISTTKDLKGKSIYIFLSIFRIDYKTFRDEENFQFVPPEQKKRFVKKKKDQKAEGEIIALLYIFSKFYILQMKRKDLLKKYQLKNLQSQNIPKRQQRKLQRKKIVIMKTNHSQIFLKSLTVKMRNKM